jgi:hypothetical protein
MCLAVICSRGFREFDVMLLHGEKSRHSQSVEIVDAVRKCIGTRFQAQGRLRGVGLDCVGVALIAAQVAGVPVTKLPAYRLGDTEAEVLDAYLQSLGLRAQLTGAPGDLWVFAPDTNRRHLAVQTNMATPNIATLCFVHAHAGVGFVVEAPAAVEWLPISIWRFPEGQ